MPKMPGICKTIGCHCSNVNPGFDQRTIQSSDQHGYGVGQQSDPHWDINRRRDVSLSLVNAQLSETSGNEIVLGLGYRFGNLPIFLKNKQLNNDINVQFDFSIRKNNTIIRRITENVDQLTAGEKVMSIKVSADYTF